MRDCNICSTSLGLMHCAYYGAEAGQRPLDKGIDVKSRGGYVVGPGSIIDGVEYRIIDDVPIAPIPAALHDRLTQAADPNVKTTAPVTELDTPAAIEFAISYVKREPGAEVGSRNNTAFQLACQLKDFGLSAETIFETMQEHWRCDDPLPEGELCAVAENAFKSGRYAPGVRNAVVEFADVISKLDEVFAPTPPEIRFDRIVQDREWTEIPARPWLVPGLLIKSSLTAIVAQPGARKSTFTVGIAVGFALGDLDFMGFKLLGGPTNVMLINNEDDEDEIDRRIAACCIMNGLDYHEAKKRIHLHKPADGSAFVAVGPDKKAKHVLTASDEYMQLRAYVKMHDIGLCIFDPLADIHHAQENDNSDMAFVMGKLRELARSEKISGLIVHHSRKPDQASSKDYAGDPFTSRGASAIHGNVRVLATLVGASEDDGYKSLGVSPPHHLDYTRFDSGKGSYSPPGKHTRWYYCDGYHVGNPDGDDTAPALKHVTRTEQVERRIEAIHKSLCEHRDLLVKGSDEMQMTDAIEIVGDSLGIDKDVAGRYLDALFKTPRTVDGITLTVVATTARKFVVRFS